MAKGLRDSLPTTLFQGYDSVTGAGRTTAVGPGTTKPTTTGASSQVTCHVCQDTKSLAEALDVSGSLSFGFADVDSIDVKAQFIQDLNLTTNSISIVVYASHIQGKESAPSWQLSGVGPPGDAKEFFLDYGDSFISSVTTGGEYYAVYAFYAETQEEKQSLYASMQAAGIIDGLTLEVQFQATLNNFLQTTTSRTFFTQSMSGIQNPEFPDETDIIAFALKFPSLTLDAPAILSFESTGYEHVPGVDTFGTVAQNRSYFLGAGVLDGLAASFVQVLQLNNQLNWLLKTYQLYGYSAASDTQVMEAAEAADIDVKAINTQVYGNPNATPAIEGWKQDPQQSFTEPSLNSLAYGTPYFNYSINNSPSFSAGESPGTNNPFSDVNGATWFRQGFWLSRIELNSGEYIDALNLNYQTGDGSQQVTHGGNVGPNRQQLTLRSDPPPIQSVTQLQAVGVHFVAGLLITLSDGRSLQGGTVDHGWPYSWSVPAGSIVLGFGGKAAEYLSQIYAIYATIQPANWETTPQARRDRAHSDNVA
jgi:hypothetical protein